MKTKLAVMFGAAFAMALFVAAEDKTDNKPAGETAPKDTPPTRIQTSTNFLVLGYIQTRGREITIKSGPKGRVYSVKTSDGKILCENASLEELRARAPELHDFVKTGVAQTSEGQKKPSVLDARINAAIR
jgi:hypothetical protein